MDLGKGGSIHDRVAAHVFIDTLIELPRPVHSISGEDITGNEEPGETLRLYEPSLSVLFGPAQDYGRYSIVKEFPYYHLDTYPEDADVEIIEDFLDSNMTNPPEVYHNQQIGDVDIGVFDRREQEVHVVEVKTNPDDIPDAESEVDTFAAYTDTLGWDIRSDIAVFSEEDSSPSDMVRQGRIEWYRYRTDVERTIVASD
ncbi:MAG: hypothetical protein ABEI07_01970 [Candidatus Nanohaloarchaea archaeon]